MTTRAEKNMRHEKAIRREKTQCDECAGLGCARCPRAGENVPEPPAATPDVQLLLDNNATLAAVGRLYLDALDDDPEHELLTLVEAYRVTQVREAVERAEARDAEGKP